MTEYIFAAPQPVPVGYWILDPGGAVHTQFAVFSKPTDEQIKNTEQMFGWKWKDAK
jgi:hypothetical protein